MQSEEGIAVTTNHVLIIKASGSNKSCPKRTKTKTEKQENQELGRGTYFPVKRILCEKEKIPFSQGCLEDSTDIMCEGQCAE